GRDVVVADLVARGVAVLVVRVPGPGVAVADRAVQAEHEPRRLGFGRDGLVLLGPKVLRDDRARLPFDAGAGAAARVTPGGSAVDDVLADRAEQDVSRWIVEHAEEGVVRPDAHHGRRRRRLQVARVDLAVRE